MIELKAISKTYGNHEVLKDINLTIPKNKMSALLGANGTGKSTLLNILSANLKADAGEVLIDGKPINEFSRDEFARTVSILHQTQRTQLKLTVKQLVAFGRYPHCQGRLCKYDAIKIDEAIAFMNLEEIADSYLDELSGGQQQRAYIAMIIAQDTPYILLDEPLNNLDLKYSAEMMKNCQRMVQELDKTIVVIMHDINFTSLYCDECVLLKGGQVLHQGGSECLKSKELLEETFDIPFTQSIGVLPL